MGLNLDELQFTKTFHWDFNLDKTVAEIPFFDTTIEISSPYTYMMTFGMTALYMVFIIFIAPMLKPKNPQTLEKIAFWHHAALCVYSLFAFLATAYSMFINDEWMNLNNLMCKPVPGWLHFISITFTLSKVWEWVDTAVMIWRGKTLKSIGFLHIYHHATTFFLFLIVMNAPGTEKYGMLFNGFVHTLMYYHYAFRLPKALRPVITIAQIIQLFSATYLWYLACNTCPAQIAHKTAHYFEYLVPYACVPVYGLFFVRFFIQEYILKKPKTKTAPAKKLD